MNHRIQFPWLGVVITALLLLGGTGCSYKLVQPPSLTVGSAINGDARVVNYPTYVLTHDSESFWDPHQIKDNLFGLTEGEVVHWFDMLLDGLTPGPANRPLENGVEWIKNSYATLPDWALVRIVGGLFAAVTLEKTTLLSGATRIAMAPADPLSYFVFTRAVYLTDWVQNTLGEFNKLAGYLTPWPGPLVPLAATAPINSAVDWSQTGAIALYVYIVHKVNTGIDDVIDGGEAVWGAVVGCFVKRRD